jgi:Lrp/AsnC family transcriptional regulator for asnA, asnC and gidA
MAHVAQDDAHESPPSRDVGRSAYKPLDELDREIVRLLQRDGRASNTDMARALGVTETTVRKRVSRLLDAGLMNVVAVPTPEALGLTVSAIFGVSVELSEMSAISAALRATPEVRYVGMSAGRYDILVEAFFADQQQLLEFVTDKLGSLKGVADVETSVILKVVKFSYEWEIA